MSQSRRGDEGAGKPRGGRDHGGGHDGEQAPGHEAHEGHGRGAEHGHGGHDRLGNPQDLAAYLARLEGPDRGAWQKPDEVIRLLGVKRGDRVCDVGAGPGYFALRLARAVGSQGEVYAFDAEPRMIEVLRQRMREQGLLHVHPVLAEEGVPPRPCDLVLVVNTFHHFRDGPAYLRRLAGHLKPGGRIVNIDFHKRDLPVGPSIEHKVAREDFLGAAGEAGLRLVAEHQVLPYQYFLVLEPRAGAGKVDATGATAPSAGEPAMAAPPRASAQPRRQAPARKTARPARRDGARSSRSRPPGRGKRARETAARRRTRR
jgi:SAM-dependent methyltransferase